MQQYDNAAIQQYNNTVRCLTGKYRKMEPDCQEGARAQLERVKNFARSETVCMRSRMIWKGRSRRMKSRQNNKKYLVRRLP